MSDQTVDKYRTKVIFSTVCAAGLCTALKKKKTRKKKEESFARIQDSGLSLCKPEKEKSFQISKNIVLSFNTNNQELAIISKVENVNINCIKKSPFNDSESKISEIKSTPFKNQLRQLEDAGSQSNLYKKIFRNMDDAGSQGNEKIKKKNKNTKEKEYNLSKLSLKQSYTEVRQEECQYREFLKDLEELDKIKKNNGSANNLIDTHIMFESDGYIEEDEDLHEKEKLDILSDNFTVTSKPSALNTNNLVFENDKIIINNEDELKEVLFGKTKYKDFNCSLRLIERMINENERVMIIKEKELLVLLAYLYKDLHPGLIELGDNFVEERRKYFKIDNDTYINIINYFLRKKEEFFLCVLSDLMSKLNISQKVLDNTFYYYMNVADNDIKDVQMIKAAYDKVYHAGLKYSIAPKNLTKARLKKVLEYQCETYDNLMKKNSSYEPDVIEIMVTDHVYLEFGLDREAIKAAIKKHNVYQDYNFENVIVKLENFQNNSFINI